MPIREFRGGAGARILLMDGISDGAVGELVNLERLSPGHHRRLLARFQRIADHGPQYKGKWWKTLEGTRGLRQLRYDDHRFLLTPHPRNKTTFVLLSYFRKPGDDTPPREIRRGLELRQRCLGMLEDEETK